MRYFFIALITVLLQRLVADFFGVSFNLFTDSFLLVDLTLDMAFFVILYLLVSLIFACFNKRKRRIFK